MKKAQVQKITVTVADKKSALPFSSCVNIFHLRYVERQLKEMQLSTDDKLTIIDGILQNLKNNASP